MLVCLHWNVHSDDFRFHHFYRNQQSIFLQWFWARDTNKDLKLSTIVYRVMNCKRNSLITHLSSTKSRFLQLKRHCLRNWTDISTEGENVEHWNSQPCLSRQTIPRVWFGYQNYSQTESRVSFGYEILYPGYNLASTFIVKPHPGCSLAEGIAWLLQHLQQSMLIIFSNSSTPWNFIVMKYPYYS